VSNREAELVLVDTGRAQTQTDARDLKQLVRRNIQPATNPPSELIERM
jgi:hypothetical protein